ncbi:hypothetical protein D0U00_04300 [Leclercia adecarboxylata]|uniref:hypothetical protein n=1 Tax=Leclercia adecarboxylata TaxID=83655 RepID=UPI000E3D3786|nr:hypothetical protein [Leclercia adecarboxylata]RFS80617.1 hypothetical protein D0U00_04300 [Leclercia adecarboxylata]
MLRLYQAHAGGEAVKWIENYAWFGRKASSAIIMFYLGLIAAWQAPDYAAWLIIPVAILFGWARDSEAANQYWATRREVK